MASITWNGLYIEGHVSRDPGIRTFKNGDPGYPPSCEVVIGDIIVDDEEEFASFLAENSKPAEWKTLPKKAKQWVLDTHNDIIEEKLAEK